VKEPCRASAGAWEALRHAQTLSSLLRASTELTSAAADASQDLQTLLSSTQQALEGFLQQPGGGGVPRAGSPELETFLRRLCAAVERAQQLALTDLGLCLQSAAISERLKALAAARALQAWLERRHAAAQRRALLALRLHRPARREEAEPEAEVAAGAEPWQLGASAEAARRLEAALERAEAVAAELGSAAAQAEAAARCEPPAQAEQQQGLAELLRDALQHLACTRCRSR